MARKSYTYVDSTGKVIKPGDMIQIGNDKPEEVFQLQRNGGKDLGVNASNEAYLRMHPEAEREYYSLSEFDLSDITIVSR